MIPYIRKSKLHTKPGWRRHYSCPLPSEMLQREPKRNRVLPVPLQAQRKPSVGLCEGPKRHPCVQREQDGRSGKDSRLWQSWLLCALSSVWQLCSFWGGTQWSSAHKSRQHEFLRRSFVNVRMPDSVQTSSWLQLLCLQLKRRQLRSSLWHWLESNWSCLSLGIPHRAKILPRWIFLC